LGAFDNPAVRANLSWFNADLVLQDHTEEGVVDLDLAVVSNEASTGAAIHAFH